MQTNGSTPNWIAIIVCVIVLAMSVSLNVIQGAQINEVRSMKNQVQTNTAFVTETRVELRYIKESVNEIKELLKGRK